MQGIDQISLKQQKQLKPSYTPAAFRNALNARHVLKLVRNVRVQSIPYKNRTLKIVTINTPGGAIAKYKP